MTLQVTNPWLDANYDATSRFEQQIKERAEKAKERAKQKESGEKKEWEKYDLRMSLGESVYIHLLHPMADTLSFPGHNRYMKNAPKGWGWFNRICPGAMFPEHNLGCDLCKEAEAEAEEAKAMEAYDEESKKKKEAKRYEAYKWMTKELSLVGLWVWYNDDEYAGGISAGHFRYLVKQAPREFDDRTAIGALFHELREQEKRLKRDDLYSPNYDYVLSVDGPDSLHQRWALEQIEREFVFDPAECGFNYPKNRRDMMKFFLQQSFNDRVYLKYMGVTPQSQQAEPEEDTPAQPKTTKVPPRQKPREEKPSHTEEDVEAMNELRRRGFTQARKAS